MPHPSPHFKRNPKGAICTYSTSHLVTFILTLTADKGFAVDQATHFFGHYSGTKNSIAREGVVKLPLKL